MPTTKGIWSKRCLWAEHFGRTWELDHPIPTHLSAIAIGPYVDHDYVHTGALGHSRAFDEQGERLEFDANQICRSASPSTPRTLVGPYAWERIGYVLTTDAG